MTVPPTDWSQSFFRGHSADHGVRAFDGNLGSSSLAGHGRIEVRRTPQGRYYALVELETALGHLCAAVHLERSSGRNLVTAGGDVPDALAPFDELADRLVDIQKRLQAAAAAGNVAPELLKAAILVIRAHAGDDRAKAVIQKIRMAAARNPAASRRLALLRQGREFARSVLADRTVTGDMFGDIGNAINNAAKGIGKAVSDVGHAIQPALDSIKQWGPAVLSDIQGVISMIPGIGTGISAAISAGIAVLDGDNPLELAIHVAYGAIPIPPGIRPICDTVLDTVLAIIQNPHDLVADAIQVARDRIPSGFPQQVFDTLVHLIGAAVSKGKASVPRNPPASAAHAITRYTKGLGPALQRGLPRLSAPVQAHLARLPDPHTAFTSIHQLAPHFAVDPKLAGPLVAHAAQQMQVRHGIAPPPPQVLARTTAAVASAVTAQAQHAAQLRLAQQAFEAPRRNNTASPASIALEVSPDGSQQRVVASDALSHLATAVT